MKILLLSPQPFYQVRGTPIAIDLLVATLSKQGHQIDLLTYHEGDSRSYENVRHLRTRGFRFLNNVKPGFSVKKLICSSIMFFQAFCLVKKNNYDLIHANEESVFMAQVYRRLFKVPYVYDMDSSLSGQMADKMPSLRSLFKLTQKIENSAIRSAQGVLAVCEALCDIARPHNANVQLLTDVSMLERLQASENIEVLPARVSPSATRFMYIGNLETYQGVDLMLEAFALAVAQNDEMSLIIIGGSDQTIKQYRERVIELAIDSSVIFLGPKPFDDIKRYMDQADVLISPRTQGENTPMKIYNYMASGKALIATDIYSHTQVLDAEHAVLVDVSPASLAKAMNELAADPKRRESLASMCQAHAEANYSVTSFEAVVAGFFEKTEKQLSSQKSGTHSRNHAE